MSPAMNVCERLRIVGEQLGRGIEPLLLAVAEVEARGDGIHRVGDDLVLRGQRLLARRRCRRRPAWARARRRRRSSLSGRVEHLRAGGRSARCRMVSTASSSSASTACLQVRRLPRRTPSCRARRSRGRSSRPPSRRSARRCGPPRLTMRVACLPRPGSRAAAVAWPAPRQRRFRSRRGSAASAWPLRSAASRRLLGAGSFSGTRVVVLLLEVLGDGAEVEQEEVLLLVLGVADREGEAAACRAL